MKAREWWIIDSPMSKVWVCEGPLNPDHQEKAFETHVLEYSPEAAAAGELEQELQSALAIIDDYLAYKHDGDPWAEDARAMGEMEINSYGSDGRLAKARKLLERIRMAREGK